MGLVTGPPKVNSVWPALGEKKSPNDVSEARMSGNILSHISPEVQKHKQ